ncbi:MAG: sugar transferase [Clostridia bacterium]|nr:sugar transferase [Clostridia bacterium]
MYNRFIKRSLDLILTFTAAIVLFPLFLILFLLIKIDSRGPVFFKQKRVGKGKRYFSILKFRTMRTDTPKDTPTHLLKDPDQYITRVGRFLRKTSLDELPQLFNIIVGQMAIVGPRPALWNQDDLVAERDKYHANDIRPGLTGWAQVNGRDELEIEVKAKFDGEYVERMSFLFDLKCIFVTAFKVLRSDGVVEGAHETEKKDDVEVSNDDKLGVK